MKKNYSYIEYSLSCNSNYHLNITYLRVNTRNLLIHQPISFIQEKILNTKTILFFLLLLDEDF